MENIFSTIRKEITAFTDQDIEIVPGYSFNQYETIKRCHLYYNSRFEDDSLYNGKEKIFFNISKPRADAAATRLDVDTKDIRLWATNPKSDFQTFLLEKELKQWLKTNHIGKMLNIGAQKAPIYGSVVIQKTGKSAKMVDLRRLFLDPTVDSIKKSRFVTLEHYMTGSEMREKAGIWKEKEIEEAISKFSNTRAPQSYEKDGQINEIQSSPYIRIYERYGEVPESFLVKGGKDNKFVRALYIVAGIDSRQTSGVGYAGEEGVVLFKSVWNKEWPFKDYHYQKTEGRWLGIGVMEDLFPVQERINELANQKRIAMEISTLRLFQTVDRSMIDNLLLDLENADVIQTGERGRIEPIANEMRNLQEFQSEEQRYTQGADDISHANNVLRGDALNASTPATNAVIANTNANTIFKFKKQNFTEMWREFFREFVLPQLVKELSIEHVLRFTGESEDLKKFDDYITEMFMSVAKGEYRDQTGFNPEPEDEARVEGEIRQQLKKFGDKRFINIRDGFYKNLEMDFDILIDDEQENMKVISDNMANFIGMIGKMPGWEQNPIMKALIFGYAKRIGISTVDLELAEEKSQSQQNPALQFSTLPQAPQPQEMPTQITNRINEPRTA